MTSPHTLGPWHAEPEQASHGRGIAICAPLTGWIIATITPEDGRELDATDWANARLMAAAPELLAALKALASTARTFRNVPDHARAWTTIDDDALNGAFAAIEQATGSHP